jgi:CBS domain containing-hemolysin-like protein
VAWWAWSPAQSLLRLFLAIALVWVVGDLLPRLLAVVAPELTGPVRRFAGSTLTPFGPLLRLTSWADSQTRNRPRLRSPHKTGATERDMLLGVFSLADTTVAEVMTPRIDIIAVDSAATREEVADTLRNSEHARLLVFDGHPDAIVGVIYAKDILASAMTDGEDILEQIVGEIQDERDTDEVAPIQELAGDQLRVDGGVALSELEATLGHSFDREDVSTVGGLVLAEFGRVPRVGEAIDLQGYQLLVEQVVRRRVRRVAVRRPAVATPIDSVERALT